jgi:hypothetical protein
MKNLEINRLIQQMAEVSGRSVESITEAVKEANDDGQRSLSSAMSTAQLLGSIGYTIGGPILSLTMYLNTRDASAAVAVGSAIATAGYGIYAAGVIEENKNDKLFRNSLETVRAEVLTAKPDAQLSVASSTGFPRLWASMKANVEAVLDSDNSRIKEAIAAGQVHSDPLIQDLVDRRISLGLSRDQLGDQVGLSRFEIAQIEEHGFSEIADMSESKMLALYKTLGVTDAMVEVHALKASEELESRVASQDDDLMRDDGRGGSPSAALGTAAMLL